jgi:hypothetical protein
VAVCDPIETTVTIAAMNFSAVRNDRVGILRRHAAVVEHLLTMACAGLLTVCYVAKGENRPTAGISASPNAQGELAPTSDLRRLRPRGKGRRQRLTARHGYAREHGYGDH